MFSAARRHKEDKLTKLPTHDMRLFSLCAGAVLCLMPSSSLRVETAAGWKTWWKSDAAPAKWDSSSPILASALRWRPVHTGVDRAELRLSGDGEAWRIRVVLVRFDPNRVRPELVRSTRDAGTLGAWSVDSLPAAAIVGVNAGQFASGHPWGWLVRNGIEEQAPGHGPLSMAMIVDSSSRVRLVEVDSIPRVRGHVRDGFQSYPTLLERDGEVPMMLRRGGGMIDLDHRDSRVALCQLRDGRVVIALTRFEGLGGVLSQLPFGLTVPEMSALTGALGCSKAVSLDGGMSGQLVVRGDDGVRKWPGLRRVPLAMVLHSRQ
jgi:hypothetical protein